MIVGVGTDILEIARVARILQGNLSARFLRKILTPAEQQLAAGQGSRRAQFVAGRFAAKEAVAKAIGCGLGDPLQFQHIEILPDEHGKPHCRIDAAVWPALRDVLAVSDQQSHHLHISISHSENHAQAFAVLELRGDDR
jgi:holo-[acyl-carrier protein] synthase